MSKYIYTFIITALFCGRLQAQLCATIDEPTVLCAGSSETLSATIDPGVAATYTWSVTTPFGTGEATLTNENTATPNINYIAPGFVDINLTTTGTCIDNVTIRRFIGSSSDIELPNNDDPSFLELCLNETITLNVLNSGNGIQSQVWSQTAGDGNVSFSTTDGTTTEMTTTGAGSVSVSHTYTDGNGCVAVDTRIFTIYEEVTATISNAAAVNLCSESTLQLLGMPAGGNGNYTHQWTLVNSSNPLFSVNDLDDPSSQNPTLTPSDNAMDGDTYTFNYTATPTGDDCDPATSENIVITIALNTLEAEISYSGNAVLCTPGGDVIVEVNMEEELGIITPRIYTVELSDGTIINNYNSGDDITVNPTTTTTYTIVSAIDQFGCSAIDLIGSETITIDETAPVVSNCPTNPEVVASANCTGTIPDYAADLNVSDDCTVTRVQSPGAGSDFATPAHGTTQAVSILLTDENNNSSICNFTVTLVDETNPVINTCPPNQNVSTDAGVCEGTVPDLTGDVMATDNCMIVSITQNPTSGTTFGTEPDDTQTVTYTVTDAGGNSVNCSNTLILVDMEAPIYTTSPSDQNFSTNNNNCNGTIPDLRGQATATDNCDNNVSISQNPAQNSTYTGAVGSTVTVMMIATDNEGNVSTNPVVLTLVDDVQPMITCPNNVTVNSEPNALVCEAEVTVGMPSVNDNCMVAAFSNDYNDGEDASDTYSAGITTVTWTVTDVSNNSQTCSMTVTVNDNTDPNIDCNDITINTDDDICGAIFTDNASIFNDNCAVETISYTYPNGNLFPPFTTTEQGVIENFEIAVGSLEFTYNVEDISGNEAECVFTVTVMDDDAPMFDNPPTTRNINVDNSNCTGVVPNLANELSVSDNCPDNVTVTQIPSAGSSFGMAHGDMITVTVSATDGPNTTTHEVILNLVDATDPTIDCEDVMANANPVTCSANVTVPAPTTSDNCNIAALINDYNNSSDASFVYPVGITNVLWTLTDVAGNTANCTSVITVNDDVDPTANCPDDTAIMDIEMCTATYTDNISMLSDNCSLVTVAYELTGETQGSGTGKLSDIVLNLGVTNVEYTVSDNTDNTVICTFSVTVSDNESPNFTQVPADQNFPTNENDCNAVVPDLVSEAMATDNCTTNVSITQNPTEGTPFDGSQGNTLEVMVIATDDNNNTTTEIVTLTLVDNTNPEIICPSNINISTDPGLCVANVTTPQPTTSDNCGIDAATLNNDFNNTDNASGEYAVGTTTVNWGISDFTGNVATCSMTVTVTDTENPVVTCADITIDTDSDICGAIYTDAATIIEDNCMIASISYTYPNGNLVPPFTTTVQGRIEDFELEVGTLEFTYDIEDATGGVTSCVFEVTVVDNTGPVITGPTADITVIANLGTCESTVPDLLTNDDYTATDNCNNASVISQSPAAGETFTGSQVVTLSSTDDDNNTGTLEIILIVEDTQNPTITCPSDISTNTDVDACEATVTILMPTTDDNCIIASLSNNYNDSDNASDTYPLGSNMVQWMVADAAGNEATCTMNVSVSDVQAPTFTTVPANQTLIANANCQATIPDLAALAMAEDNCSSVTISQSPAAGMSFGGSHGLTQNVVLTATDNNNNMGMTTVVLTLSDEEAPSISSCAPDQIANANSNCIAMVPDLTSQISFTDNCTASINQSPAPNTTFTDSQVVTFTVSDENGHTTTCNTTIFAFDNAAPVISGCDNLVKNVHVSSTLKSDACIIEVPDFTADLTVTDNCDMNLTFSQTPVIGSTLNNQNGMTTNVSILVSDDNGNTSSCSATLTIVDDVAPLFRSCPINRQVTTSDNSATVTWNKPVAMDECDMQVTIILDAQGVNTTDNGATVSGDFPIGTTTVTYSGTDDAGNQELCVFKVIVE